MILFSFQKVGELMNSIETQLKQHEKICYIANCIIKYLQVEDCTLKEYTDIFKYVEQRILGKSIYEGLEYENK